MFFDDDSNMLVEPDEEPHIDAAVSTWLSSGKTVDSILSITLLDGTEFKVLTSTVMSWYVTTAADRKRSWELERDLRDERKQHRLDAGLYEGDS